MEVNSYTLWLFDKRGSRLYGFTALFLFIIIIALPILFSLQPVLWVLAITIGMVYIFYGLPRVFAYQIEFRIEEEFLRIKPLKQTRWGTFLERTDIPYESIYRLESYGIDHSKNGYYHINLKSEVLSIALKCTGVLSIKSIDKAKELGLRIKELLESKAVDFEWIGEEKVWQSASMKIQMWISAVLILGMIVFTIYLFFTRSLSISDSAYIFILLFEFFFLIIGFSYYWKKFRSHNS